MGVSPFSLYIYILIDTALRSYGVRRGTGQGRAGRKRLKPLRVVEKEEEEEGWRRVEGRVCAARGKGKEEMHKKRLEFVHGRRQLYSFSGGFHHHRVCDKATEVKVSSGCY